ncbi:MAG: hypothetical protein IPP40_08350 [bacterium]|nr:hypothetical protein [bacterium]
MAFLISLFFTALAFAVGPAPVTRSAAELAVSEAKLSKLDSTVRLEQGIALLEQFPADVPAGKEVQKAIIKLLPDPQTYFRERHTKLQNPASFYLYARATDFTLPEQDVQAWLDREPDNYWLWLCYMATEWHKESPDRAKVLERIEKAIIIDPSRPEGYSFLGMFFDEQNDLKSAREAYESGLIADPADKAMRSRLLDICLSQRDAQSYFTFINGAVPETPIDVELGTIGKTDLSVEPNDLRGHVSLFVYWSMGSEICINHTLADINKAIKDEKIKWPVYAVHVGGDATDASPLISDTDRNGTRWSVNFIQSADDLDLRLNAPTKPCVFVVGADGYVHALVNGKGHEQDLLDSVIWLAEQVQSGM